MTSSCRYKIAMTMWNLYAGALALLCVITGVDGESCPVYTSYGHYNGYQNCGNGCCGSYPDYYCCTLSSAAVAGIVLGAIVVTCLLVFLCAACLKKKSHSGRVIRPVQPATNNTIVYTGTSGGYPMAAAPTQPPQPPPYKQFDNPPPYYAAETSSGRNQIGHHPDTGMAPNQYGQHGPVPTPSYPYGMRATGAVQETPPPQYASSTPAVAPSAAVPPSAAPPSATRQYNYGQSHGWSGDATATPSAAPSTSQHAYGQGQGWSESGSNRHTTTSGLLHPSRLPPLPND